MEISMTRSEMVTLYNALMVPKQLLFFVSILIYTIVFKNKLTLDFSGYRF